MTSANESLFLVDAPQVRTRLVGTVAAVLVVLSFAGAMGVGAASGPQATPVVSWLWISAATLLAMSLPVRVQFGQTGLDVTALDAVIAAGLWLLPWDQLTLAVLLGALVHLLLVQGHRGITLLVNIALVVVHTVLATIVLAVLIGTVATDQVALGPTVLATTAGAVASALVVLLLAVLDEGEAALSSTYGVVAANVGVAVAAGTSGVMAVDMLLSGRAEWWFAVLPLLLTVTVAAAYGRERSRASGLRGAMQSTQHVHDAGGPVEALRTMVREIGLQFDAGGAELHRLPAGGGTPARFSVGSMDSAGAIFASEPGIGDIAALLPAPQFGRPATGWGMSMCIDVPDGDVVRVRVLREPGSARPYSRSDLELFEDMCRSAIISFETSQMNETLARLHELDEMKTAFLTAVSHDLRTPLAVVLAGVLTLSKHHDRVTLEQRSMMLDRMAVQARRLDQMLLDLLDIDRLQRGVIEPNRVEIDVTAAVTEVVAAVAANTHPVQVSQTSVTGRIDRGHLSRIVENLVRNAVKYTPEGTPIWVDVRRDATGAQLIVSDAGPGVPEEQREAIFGAFVRGDDTSASPGTGVGLDLVRRLAELHGGRAWVDARPGGGARFWVTLPNTVVPRTS